jgi:hypothetical protein
MSEWIRLDSAALNKPRREDLEGVTVTVQLSPHDVPCGVRGSVIADRKFLVEFRYIDDEAWRLEPHSEGIAVRVGKHSGRLYGVEINRSVFEKSGGSVSIGILAPDLAEKTIDSEAETPARMRVAENFRVARDAIASVASKLFPSPAQLGANA